MKELSCRWVMPNRADFWRRLVTVDETWIHYYTPENRMSARQWTEAGTMGRKGYGVGFLGLSWHTLRGLPRKRKIHQQRVLLYILEAIEGRNRCKTASRKAKKKVVLQDNAPAHKSIATTAKINDLRLQLLSHPPCSPDLAPSGYYFFPNLKRSLINKKFSSREGIIDATEEYFADLPENYFSDGVKKLENRWNKCIKPKGGYIE